MNGIEQLQPQSVWYWFSQLCKTPRASFQEAAIREVLITAAQQKGLTTEVDDKGNLRIHKPATSGMEHKAPIAIQAHMDMVAQKGADSNHDFSCDPIHPRIIDGWVWADNTTLGADNGIGLAMGLAVLFSYEIAHPALTLIVTVEEETGMGGAEALPAEWLDMPYLINLDTETSGELYIGCAGGCDASLSLPLNWENNVDEACLIRISGLRGGHSGVDIDKNHANANLLLARLLTSLYAQKPFVLASWQGGELRNVITREAQAIIVGDTAEIKAIVAEQAKIILAEWPQEENLLIEVLPVTKPAQTINAQETCKVLDILMTVPNGVLRMSDTFQGVVETSSNIGEVKITDQNLQVHFLVRSLLETPKVEVCQKLQAIARLAEATLKISGDYPGWAPDATSGLLKITQQVFTEHFGYEPPLKIIHAGLECGILGGKAPKMEMISFGPDIRAAHSPYERVNIATVLSCWQVLLKLLQAIPDQA